MGDPVADTCSAEGRCRQFELLVESVRDYAVFLIDADGRVASWNEGARRINGYAPEDVIGEHIRGFYLPEDQQRGHPDEELAVAAREGRSEEEGWRVRKDGSRFWANVVISAVRDADGTLTGFGHVTRDLTARRLSEEQMRVAAIEARAANEDLAQFRRLVSSVRDYAIFMLDPRGLISTWNAGAEHIKGYAAEEVIGREFSLFYTPADKERGHPAKELEIAAREGRFEEEGWRVRKDGAWFWASVVITAVRDEDGILLGFAKVTRDLSARREAEEELRRAHRELEQSNTELQRFAAVAAHDLREPLATVAGFAEVLRRRESDQLSAGGQDVLRKITDAVTRMQHLIGDLLAYASLGEDGGAVEPVALSDVTERVLEGLQAAIGDRGAVVHADVPVDAAVLSDRSGVDVVLQNLVSNALKFGDPERPEVRVSALPVDGGWRVTVADNGNGIAPEDQHRIFAAFQRLPRAAGVPGTGLGLSICSRVVERSGGQLGIDSAPGEGSRFWFWLRAPAGSIR